ncbi:riboflavin kinase-domain-containing protein [Scheffersomyces amazonensis]|uniref:riboflavin kinase-domain-containing protein n=1 Tax=Scheffersomyces amazonensis TaxID=1078765 RepID=UPI00315CEC38
MTRPETIVPEEPISPFPITQESRIISGFGRGSSELGIPTANIPINKELNDLDTGIYYGWCKLLPHSQEEDELFIRQNGKQVKVNHGRTLCKEELTALPMVMSIGWNPFYHNKEKAAEVHIIHKFDTDFYGASVKYNVLGYIRPELNYTTKEALIDDINLDIKIAKEILETKDNYSQFKYKL